MADIQGKWVKVLRANRSAGKLHCPFCPSLQGYVDDQEMWHHIARTHEALIPQGQGMRVFQREALSQARFVDPNARASATSEKQNTVQREEETFALMALNSGSESRKDVEHSSKKMALGNGASPKSSLTTKSETEDGDSEDYFEDEDEGGYEEEADSEEDDECHETEEIYAMRPKSTESPPINSDFGPRAATGKYRLFDPSDRGATRSAPIKQIQRRPVQKPRAHRSLSQLEPIPKNTQDTAGTTPELLPMKMVTSTSPLNGAQAKNSEPRSHHGSLPGEKWRIVSQPDTKPISQDQLVAEVKGIYAGLVMVEGKCIQVDLKQTQLAKEAAPGPPPTLNNEQYQALIALHRTLLHEHHDFFLASQHPSASPAVKRLAVKYAMPARLWRHGIHSFLELLRNRLPHSLEYMLSFIYLAYSMMTLLLETVPAFEDTWVECLGDLGRYRMAIEDENIRDREVWTQVARQWYLRSANRLPKTGRLYHHLAILARPEALSQLMYYGKALSVGNPFLAARESIMTLFNPILQPNGRKPRYPPHTAAYVRCHATIFTGYSLDDFNESLEEFKDGLDSHIERNGKRYLEQGYQVALSNCMAVMGYGSEENPLTRLVNQARQRQLENEAKVLPQQNTVRPVSILRPNAPSQSPPQFTVSSMQIDTLQHALDLFNKTAEIHFKRLGDMSALSFMHVTLVFLHYMSNLPGAMDILAPEFPWTDLATMLNSVIDLLKPALYNIERSTMFKPERELKRNLGLQLLVPEKPTVAGDNDEAMPPTNDEFRPFPEEWAMQGLVWTQDYFPMKWFKNDNLETEKHYVEAESMKTEYRPERVAWLGVQIARSTSQLIYDCVTHQFSACADG